MLCCHEHMRMLCCHVLRVMDVLNLEEIPPRLIVERCMRDARDILPLHLSQYQKDQAANQLFTCRHSTLNVHELEVVRMGDASAEAFEHMRTGLKVLLVSCAPLAEKRDGLGLED